MDFEDSLIVHGHGRLLDSESTITSDGHTVFALKHKPNYRMNPKESDGMIGRYQDHRERERARTFMPTRADPLYSIIDIVDGSGSGNQSNASML